ncbi:MAG: hypothetical protein JXR70_02180 [Spirochaetales bacterium]|nr:hypothetical protein [Spirochaetales bacterium]
MGIRILIKAIILVSTILLISGCAFFFYPPTGEIDTVNIKVNFTVDSTLPSGTGYIGLFNEMNELIQMQEAKATGIYNFSNVELQHPNMSYRKTKLAFFIDKNLNSKYDSTNIEESQSFAVTSVLDMQLYTEQAAKEEMVSVNAMIFKVSGYINFHADMGNDINKKYLYWKGSKDSTYKIVKSNIDGSFEFYEGTRNDGSIMELYAFYDVDGDGIMNQLVDKVTFIGLYGTYGEINISPAINITKVYGKIDLGEIVASGVYNLQAGASGSGNRAIIRVENRQYWRTFYVLPENDGDFNIFLVPSLSNDIVLYHVAPNITNYETQFQDHLMYPLRLAGPSAFPNVSETEIYGVGGTGTPLILHEATVEITNNTVENTGTLKFVARAYRLNYLVIDQYLIAKDGSTSGIAPSQTKEFSFFFRDFDKDTNNITPFDGPGYNFPVSFYLYTDYNGNLTNDANENFTPTSPASLDTINSSFTLSWYLN